MGNFVEGNFEDKYNTKNPISKILVDNFLKTFEGMLNEVATAGKINSVCEVGVGEGELLKIVYKKYPKVKLFACDLSKNEISKAKENLKNIPVNYSIQNAEDLSEYKDNQFDLVICCEVLEHLKNPSKALRELKRISKKYVIVSVPNEPIWRILNMVRGKYLSDFGNTPGHLNHWNIFSFSRFIKSLNLINLKESFPFPWQMKLINND